MNYFKSLYNKAVLHRWDLAFVENPIEDILNGKPLSIRRVKYKFHGQWFADPFILDYNDQEIILLVEDYADSDKIGKISKLVIDRNTMILKDVKLVLSIPSHLSFPAIIRKGQKIYIYPENSQGGGLWLYEYDPVTDQCERIRQLSNRPLADAIITNAFGESIIFSTEEPHPNENQLGVYSMNEDGLYDLNQQIIFHEKIARNAGDFFKYGGHIFRPAQECNVMYGHAISLQEIQKKKSGYELNEIRRIMPPIDAFGIHTFNTYKGLTVIDLKVFRQPWIAKPLFWLRNLFKQKRYFSFIK